MFGLQIDDSLSSARKYAQISARRNYLFQDANRFSASEARRKLKASRNRLSSRKNIGT